MGGAAAFYSLPSPVELWFLDAMNITNTDNDKMYSTSHNTKTSMIRSDNARPTNSE